MIVESEFENVAIAAEIDRASGGPAISVEDRNSNK